MTKVTKESLAENIGRLESYGDLSINEELRCPFCQFVVDESDFEDHECAACGAYLE